MPDFGNKEAARAVEASKLQRKSCFGVNDA